jgi:3-hydroxyisobutyrate dehydrogenase-like beta-hydroxyacid dehydrogenase
MGLELAIIGFGEAGRSFARAAAWADQARVYDRETDGPAAADMRAAYDESGVTSCETAKQAVNSAIAILSLVTADQAMDVALNAAPHIAAGALYFDMNSVAPATKQAAAEAIEAAGGHYLDVAIMSPVNPARMATPLLVSGPYAARGMAMLSALGFTNVNDAGDAIGRASTIKMLRSVMYKGVEALTAECLIACARAGVTDEVLASFGNDWSSGADYRLDRMLIHGERRAAEMEEVAKTLEALGVEPLMTCGTIVRQRAIGGLSLEPVDGLNAKLEGLLRHPELVSVSLPPSNPETAEWVLKRVQQDGSVK